jgi:hypothetical protein
MYPKYNFDDTLNAIDRLGKKKEVAVHMTRYRLDQLTKDEDERILSDGDDDEENRRDQPVDEPMDEFEALINEQIALTTLHSRTNNDSGMDKSFGNISSISSATKINDRIASSTHIHHQSQPTQPPSSTSQVQITDEVRLRIEENKRKALAIRDQRKKEAEEKQRLELEESQKAVEVSNIHIDDDF